MAKQSISFAQHNRRMVKITSRQARKQQVQIGCIRAKIDKAEESGFTKDSKEDILRQSKSLLNHF